jgi:hypothetical protein
MHVLGNVVGGVPLVGVSVSSAEPLPVGLNNMTCPVGKSLMGKSSLDCSGCDWRKPVSMTVCDWLNVFTSRMGQLHAH